MNHVEVALVGRVSQEPQVRESKAGKPWCAVNVGVGEGDAVQWVKVLAFGDMAATAGGLAKGVNVYVEGRGRVEQWTTKTGEARPTLSVTATRLDVLGRIGRRRPAGEARARRSNAPADNARPLDQAARSGASLDDLVPF